MPNDIEIARDGGDLIQTPLVSEPATRLNPEWARPITSLTMRDWWFLAAAFLIGAAGRLSAAFRDFPVNDGGLFHAMIVALLDNDFALPIIVEFNSFDVPFVYPPLPFYVTAAISALGPAPELLLRILPGLVSTATILAVFRLARSLGLSRMAVYVATFAFAVSLRGFSWTVMGGGITRAPGYLFAILATAELIQLLRADSRRRLPLAVVLVALTMLSHPEATLVLAASGFLLAARSTSDWPRLLSLCSVAILALIVITPWWGYVIAHHGLDPFAGAGGSALPLSHLARIPVLPLVSGIGPLALIGIFVCFVRRDFFLPAWLLLVLILTGEFRTYVSAPLALLAGVGLSAVPWYSLPKPAQRGLAVATVSACVVLVISFSDVLAWSPITAVATGDWIVVSSIARKVLGLTGDPGAFFAAPIVLLAGVGLLVAGWPRLLPAHMQRVGVVVFGCLLVVTSAYGLLRSSLGPVLSKDDRAAMEWVSDHTPPGARIVVMSGSPSWGLDPASEWFGSLAERNSIATPQGSEWVGMRSDSEALYFSLQECATQEVECLKNWSAHHAMEFEYVFLPETPAGEDPDAPRCCQSLTASLRASGEYEVVYETRHTTVMVRRK